MSEPTINTAAELASKQAGQNDQGQTDARKTLSISRSAQALELRERLQKVLATSGLGARRGMEERILKGEITLNGAVPELGAQVKVGDRIGVDERIFVVKMQEGDFGRILLYNKPDGEVTTRHDPEGRKTVFETLPRLRGSRWIAVGRLDINTQGLLVFTTNGDLAQKLMHPENEFEREYLCRVHGEVTEEIVAKLLAGVELEDGPAAVSLIESMDSAGGSNEWWRVVIKEGRNREIRRLWEAVGLTVSRLKRASFGPFTLPKGLHRGELAELDLADTQKICVEMGISQTPSQLIAEDESAGRLRRNRVVEGVEGKKRFIAAGKGKAEAFWTGERGYGGAGSRPVRSGGGEFDLGGVTGSERPRDGRPKRGKGAPMRGRPGAGRAAFVGPMGMSSFDANVQGLNGPNSVAPNARNPRGPRGPGGARSTAPGGNGGNAAGPRNDRRGQRRGPAPSTPLVDADGAPILGNDGQARFAPRPNRHRSGPRPAGGRPHNTAPQDVVQGQEPVAAAVDRSRPGGRGNGANPSQVPREPGMQRGRGPRRDRPAGEPRVGDIGNRIGESVGRKRVGFMRGALGTAETYDARSIHADSEDFGNRIAGAQPRQPRPENPARANRAPRGFSGPMDNAHPRDHDAGRPEVDGNSARAEGSRQPRQPGANPNPRNPNSRGRGDQRGRNPNGAPQANREPRPPGEARPPREPRPPGEARPPREPRPPGEARPPREPRPPGEARLPREPRPPRAPALDANGAPIERAPNDARPRNRNRRRRGPRPEGNAPTGAAPSTTPSSNSE